MDYRFPQYLNKPLQVLWMEADELAIFFGGLMIALMYSSWILWTLPFVGPWIYGKLKSKYPRGFLKHCLYFAGFINVRGYPTFFETEFNE